MKQRRVEYYRIGGLSQHLSLHNGVVDIKVLDHLLVDFAVSPPQSKYSNRSVSIANKGINRRMVTTEDTAGLEMTSRKRRS